MSLAPAVFLGGEIGTRVADITYIRPHREFVDLVVLLDAFSGRCIGWLLESASEASLTLEALRMAFGEAEVRAGAGASLRPRCAATTR